MKQPGSETDAAHGDEGLSASVYARLHELAAGQLRGGGSRSLQPTLLVHEAWLRIRALDEVRADQRGAYLALACKAMRSVVVDHARRALAAKRRHRDVVDDPEQLPARSPWDPLHLLALDEALHRLAAVDRELVEVVERLWFGGQSIAEAAADFGVSERTVERRWRLARAWLRHALGDGGEQERGR